MVRGAGCEAFASVPVTLLLGAPPNTYITVAGRLHAAGMKHGDRILVSAEPSVELVVAYVAALRLGLVVVPANSAYRQGELAHIVSDATPVGAIIDDPTRASCFPALTSMRSSTPHVFSGYWQRPDATFAAQRLAAYKRSRLIHYVEACHATRRARS